MITKTRRLTSTFALLLATAACDRPAAPEIPTDEATYAPTKSTFGEAHTAFVSFVDAFGAFAVVHEFDRDTDGDGTITARLGDHGEPTADLPSAALYTLPDGRRERFDELLTTSTNGRWAILRRGTSLVAVSAGQRWTVNDADLTPDASPCEPAREASIDPTGRWLVFLRADPPRAVVKDLHAGTEREVEPTPSHTLWRADAMPHGWVRLRELADDGAVTPPRTEGTCACRWCGRFATSIGTTRTVGDTPRDIVVNAVGVRAPAPDAPLPVGFDLVWSLTNSRLTRLGGEAVPLGHPSGRTCKLAMAPLGSHRLVLDCHGESFVWESNTGQLTSTEARVRPLDMYAPPNDAGRVPVAFTDADNTQRVGLLDLGSGGIEHGPPATRWGAPHPSGWRIVAGADAFAWDTNTNIDTQLQLTGAKFQGLTAQTDASWFVVDPVKPVPIAVDREPHWVAANGCYIEPHPYRELQRGPFTWVCP